jgi:tetratricopeptide (TPR) repeat protein
VVPARELLGETLLELERPAAALAEFERTLDASPNRFRSLYGAARAAELAGEPERAREYYRKLLDVDGSADVKRPELLEAREFMER